MGVLYVMGVVFNRGWFLSLKEHWQWLETVLAVIMEVVAATGVEWTEVWEAVRCPTLHRGSPTQTISQRPTGPVSLVRSPALL